KKISPDSRLLRTGILQERKLRAVGFLEQVGILDIKTTGWRASLDQVEREEDCDRRTYLQRLQAIDCREWLSSDLLTKIDRCLMWHGLEGRTPLVDVNVARFAFMLPDDCKIGDGAGKLILRMWLQSRHPQIDAFGKKRGFTVPAGQWIQQRGSAIADLVARQPGIMEICRPDHIRSFFADLSSPERRYASWILLFYALWHHIHVMGHPAQPNVEETLRLR
ncbi:MAG: asparagine synthase-related protein, partial [Terriglobales bacterium]